MTECASLNGKSVQQLKDELGRIVAKSNALPLSARLKVWALFLPAYCKLARLRTRLERRLRNRLLVILLVVAAAGFYPGLSRRIDTLRYDRCLIEQPSLARNLFRPAQDCSICRDVRSVDKISNVDPKLFEERYAYTARPVVVSDATVNWTAMHVFSFAFFKELYRGDNADCQFFPYNTEFQSLKDVFNMSVGRALLQAGSKPWYVGWSNCDEAIGVTLREHYDRPYFLPRDAENEKTDWIFMGSPGYGAPMHVDDVEYPSWQAQIQGRKTWILEPPRECHYTCQRLQVTVNPGEIIVLDTNTWYHQTLIVSEELSITIGAEYD